MTVIYLIRVKATAAETKFPWEVGTWVSENSAYYGSASFNATNINEATVYDSVESADAAIRARTKHLDFLELEIVPFAEVM